MNDEWTANKLRVSYAKLLVELDVSAELKDEITIRDPEAPK